MRLKGIDLRHGQWQEKMRGHVVNSPQDGRRVKKEKEERRRASQEEPVPKDETKKKKKAERKNGAGRKERRKVNFNERPRSRRQEKFWMVDGGEGE